MKLLRLALCASVLSSAAHGALACSPSRNIDIVFPKNQARITAVELRKLADFSVSIKLDYPHHDFLGIAGIATDDERAPEALARRRAEAVRGYFERTRYSKAPLEVASHVYPARRHTASDNLHRVEVMLAPAPPHGCTTEGPK